ncbi:MAG: hypothetical protein M3464_15010, partial [Chloroflexota bacterium]|nr:hypothetical protein [Chloroflexota bacterium]
MRDTAPAGPALRSRRALLQAGLGAALLWPLTTRAGFTHIRAGHQPAASRTWLLGTASELRPTPLPPPSQADIAERLFWQADGPGAHQDAVNRWGSTHPVLPWTDTTLDLIRKLRPSPPRAARA